MAIAIRQSLGGEIMHAVSNDFFGLLTLHIFSLSAKRGFDSERWFTVKYKQDRSISGMSSSLDLSSSTTCHNLIFTGTCKILPIKTKFHCQNWTIMRLDILPHIKIMKALNDYKPIEEEWSIHAKNYSNTEKQICLYLAGILQVEEQRQRQRQRQKQNLNDMIHTR